MGSKKKRRSLEQRIKDAKAELTELENKKNQQALTNALEEGLVSKDNETEFKKLQKDGGALTKAAKIAEAYEDGELKDALEALRDRIDDAMRNLIEGGEGGGNDDEEYEEE